MQFLSTLTAILQLVRVISGAIDPKPCEVPIWLSAIKHGYASMDDGLVIVKCNDWYELSKGASTWRCDDADTWVKMNNSRPPDDRPLCTPVCGMKGGPDRPLVSIHVAGGENAAANEWPWLIFMNGGRDAKIDAAHMTCGGSLISPNYVLTAAHCVVYEAYPGGSIWANHTHIWLGVHDRREPNVSNMKYVLAEHVLPHPEYHKASDWDFDVALIKLSQTVTMTDRYRPVCLPTAGKDFDLVVPGATGEVAGWGLFNGFQDPYTVLQAEFPVVGEKKCVDEFRAMSARENSQLPPGLRITRNMFCAGLPAGVQNTCEGDSGGPFVMKKPSDDKYYAVGLVSFGVGGSCGKIFSYTGYTRLNKEIVRWIRRNTDNLH